MRYHGPSPHRKQQVTWSRKVFIAAIVSAVNFPGGLKYTAGVPQHLVVTITDPVQRRWGFQVTARQANNSRAQAGSFTPNPEGYPQLVCTQTSFQTQVFGSSCPPAMPLQYIEHTPLGTRAGARGSVSFQFDWTPPATDMGNVVNFAAANAANGDNSVMSDHIYYERYTLSAAPPVPPNPLITGVVNAASSDPTIAAGSWVTITGSNLAHTSRSLRADEIVNGMLPMQLDGVSLTIDGNPAYVSYISPTQITAQAPSDDSLGPVRVVVNNNNLIGDFFTAQLQATSPAFYVWAGKYSVATKANCGPIGPAGLFAGVTAAPSQSDGVITLWGMGFGGLRCSVSGGRVRRRQRDPGQARRRHRTLGRRIRPHRSISAVGPRRRMGRSSLSSTCRRY